VSTCSFLVIVKSSLSAPPHLTLQGGLPDNFAPPGDAAVTTPCIVSAVLSLNPFGSLAGFDGIGAPWMGIYYPYVGHHFGGLPANIVKAELVVRMKPGNHFSPFNDRIYVGITGSCSTPTFLYNSLISALPGAGGTWGFGTNGPTTFTLDLGTLNPALLALMNTSFALDVIVGDTTVVDYMRLRLWPCPPPHIPPNGVPYDIAVGGSSPSALVFLPQPELPGFGPIGQGSAVAVRPPGDDPTQPNSVQIGVGGGQAYGFTTILDMNAPEGAEIVLSVPTGNGTNAPLLTLVKGKCPPKCNWDIKANKKVLRRRRGGLPRIRGEYQRRPPRLVHGDGSGSRGRLSAHTGLRSPELTSSPSPSCMMRPRAASRSPSRQRGAPALQWLALPARLGRHHQGTLRG